MKIGLYPMVADVLHIGHVLAIEEAKSQCDYLIVALHCFPNYKNPIQSVYERFMQLRAVKWVDEVIPYTNVDDIRNMLQSLNYDIYFLGEDHKNTNWECCDVVNSMGKDIIYLNRKHTYSSSDLKQRLIESSEINKNEK